jgi:hypothetical protein
MNPRLKRIAVEGLRWTVGLVVLLESCRLAFLPSQIHAFSKSGLPGWIRPGLAGSEIVAAVLFLMPLTSVAGSYLLLLVFLLAALVHVLARAIRRGRAGGVQHGGAGEPSASARPKRRSGA